MRASHTTRTPWIAVAVALVACLFSPLTTAAQNSPAPDRQPWTGSVTAVAQTPLGWTETLEGSVSLKQSDHDAELFELEGGTLTWRAQGTTTNGCSVTGGPYVVLLDPSRGDTGSIWVYNRDGSYNGVVYFDYSVLFDMVTVTCPDQEPNRSPGILSIIYIGSQDPTTPSTLIEEGTRMLGTYEVFTYTGLTTFAWDLTNSPVDLELVVELDGYDTWLPEAGADEQTRGNSLTVRAKLQNSDGTPTTRTASRVTFQLVEGTVSRDPGVALNYPSKDIATEDYDLRFEYELNDLVTISDDGQEAVIEGGSIAYAAVELSSFDWGAYGALKVTAEVERGQTLLGKLLSTGDTEILIPKRTPGSFIADYWKQTNDAAGLPDDDDSDPEPVGDQHEGDGLSLYEEYRGFIENGEHFRSEPRRKDFFIRDTIGGRTKAGIAMFARGTGAGGEAGLHVHHEFLESEWDESNVINFNGRTHRYVDQHGIYIIPGSQEFVSSVVSNNKMPGLPRNIRWLELSQSWMQGLQIWSDEAVNVNSNDYFDSTTAHELGHTVNVWHHGEHDVQAAWTIKRDESGVPLRDTDGFPVITEIRLSNGGPGVWGPVEIRLESGARVAPRRIQRDGHMQLTLGMEQGQHSGDVSCVMRYINAAAYPLSNESNVRYLIRDNLADGQGFGERPGQSFCASHVGTEVNDPGRTSPKPRYGNAHQIAPNGPKERGRCLHRVCVNDRLEDH